MEILDFMDKAISVEDVLSECYRAMSTRCEPRYVAQMTGLSLDEVNHERILDLGRAFVVSSPGLFSTVAEPEAVLNEVSQALRPLLESIRSERGDRRDNLAKLWELEISLERVHRSVASVINDPTLRALFKGLSAGGQNHAAALEGILSEILCRQPSAPSGLAAGAP